MPKYWALGAALAATIGFSFAARAQTIPDEYSKRIASHSELGTLTGDFAGDRIDLSSGSLEIVQTDIDLATMEGANESARAATNALLDQAGSSAERAQMFKLLDPPEFAALKAADALLYGLGRPNLLDLPLG